MLFDELYVDSLGSVSRAVQSQDMQLLQVLLQNGHMTNEADNRGWTPLHVAANEGYVEAVRHLVTADDIQIEALSHCGLTPLYFACRHTSESHRKVVEVLLSAGADANMALGDTWVVPLHKATERNNLEVVRMLLDGGGDPNIISYKNLTALHTATEVGALEIAQLLLERGADLNISQASEHTALHCLCHSYKQNCASVYNDMLDLFLAHGSNINVQMADGATPLMLAVQACWDRAVDQLLEHGADVYLMKYDDNILVLHFAIQFCADPGNKSASGDGEEQEDSSILKKILSRISCDRIPREGYSVFHLAIQWKRYNGLYMLLEKGLNPDEFLQDLECGIIDCDETVGKNPLIVEIEIGYDTPLGFLLFQSLSREVVDVAKYMIDKGSNINALKYGVLPPLVAALKNRDPQAYEEGGLGQEILQYLLARKVDIMYKTRKIDVLPAALYVSSLFNVVGFFRLLQHGVPAHRIYTHDTLMALVQHYRNGAFRWHYAHFPWLLVSWLRTANLFIPCMPLDTQDMFITDRDVPDENLTQAWQQLGDVIATPKSLQHLCVLEVRRVLGEGRGWEKLQDSLNQLHMLPDPILDLLYFRWVNTSTLQLSYPASSSHLYLNANLQSTDSSDDEP